MSIDSLQLDMEGQLDNSSRGTGSPKVAPASVDSLDQDLGQQLDERFLSTNDGLQHYIPIRVVKRSRNILGAARQSLAQPELTPRDYQGLVRFLASCPIPTVDRSEVRKTEFLGSGYTMTVFKGVWKASGKSQVIAVKYLRAILDKAHF